MKISQMNNMPKVHAAFRGWESDVVLTIITQTNVDGFVQNVEKEIKFRGTVQPLKAQEIQLKPEGQRSFEWLQIHAQAGDTNLNTNDRIRYFGRDFKIMALNDYTANGFIEYHAVKDFEDEV